MLTLPTDVHHYYLNFLGLKEHIRLAGVCKNFYKIVHKPLVTLKMKRVLANPCHYHHIPEGQSKKFYWQALQAQDRLLQPFIAKDEFERGGLCLARKDNLYLIALSGKIYFLVSCNLFAYSVGNIEYKVEFAKDVLKITDQIESGNAFEPFMASKVYDGVNCDGLDVGDHENSNNWKSQFDYLGRSLFDKKFYLKILDQDVKKIFLIKTTNDVVTHVFTTVYASNAPFHMAPYARVFSGSVFAIEHHHSYLILKNEHQYSIVFVKERKDTIRIQYSVKAVVY